MSSDTSHTPSPGASAHALPGSVVVSIGPTTRPASGNAHAKALSPQCALSSPKLKCSLRRPQKDAQLFAADCQTKPWVSAPSINAIPLPTHDRNCPWHLMLQSSLPAKSSCLSFCKEQTQHLLPPRPAGPHNPPKHIPDIWAAGRSEMQFLQHPAQNPLLLPQLNEPLLCRCCPFYL